MRSFLPYSHSGFTLIELLIVVAIIALLAAFIIVGGNEVLDRARKLDTQNRIASVQRELNKMGSEQGSAALALQQAAALGGVYLYGSDANSHVVPQTGSWPDYTTVNILRFPWGKEQIWFLDEDGNGISDPQQQDPMTFSMDTMDPVKSGELLEAAGIVDSLTSYQNDRNSNRSWNDAWGNPLILAWALYQYGPDTNNSPPVNSAVYAEATSATAEFNRQFDVINKFYGHTRSVYVVIGALGSQPNSYNGTDVVDSSILNAAWNELMSNANRDPQDSSTALWKVDYGVANDSSDDRNAFISPPWNDVNMVDAEYGTQFLSAPMELQ